MEELTALTAGQLKQLKQLNWLEQQYNLILLGPPGIGKTFLAVGLGIEVVNHLYERSSIILTSNKIPDQWEN